MPTPRKPRNSVQESVMLLRDAALAPDTDIESEPPNVALENVLAELSDGDGAKVIVSRMEAQGGRGRKAYLFECQPSEFSLAEVQAHYGAGDYSIFVRGPKGICANRTISIGASREAARAPASAATVQAPPAAIHPEVKMMLEQQQRLLELVMARAGGGQTEAIANLKTFAEALGVVRPAQAVPTAHADPLAQFGMFMKFMEQVQGLAKTQVPADADVDTVLLSKGMDLVQGFFTAARDGNLPPPGRTPPAAPALALVPPPQPAPPAPAGAAVPLPPDEDEDMQMLKAQMALVMRAAAHDADVETYAGVVFENLPDDMLDQLKSDTWLTALCVIEPRAVNYKPWFEKLRARVLEMLAEESDASSSPTDPAAAG